MDGQTNKPKQICIIYASYVPDKLKFMTFYHLNFKCDLDLHSTNLHFFHKESKSKINFFFLGGEVEGGWAG